MEKQRFGRQYKTLILTAPNDHASQNDEYMGNYGRSLDNGMHEQSVNMRLDYYNGSSAANQFLRTHVLIL